MIYTPLSKETYIENRKNFASKMMGNSLAIFNSNDILPTNADGTLPFRQNNDLLYLSGVDQEESILVLFPEAFQNQQKEILFLKETNENIAIWEGEKLSKEKAQNLSGVKNIMWLQEFPAVLKSIMAEAEHVYLNSNEHTRTNNEVETRDARFAKSLMENYPFHKYERSAPIMHQLRAVKSKAEVEQMQKACNITEKAFRRVLKFIKPGVMEYEIQAEIMHEFLRNRSRGFAYEPIIASGFNACVLHYIENDKECKSGDLILMDIGAEFGNYASDMTRTVPVNGKFTERQKDVYNAVLRVMRKGMTLLRPGVYLKDYHKQIGDLMEKELIGLGLLNADDVARQDPEKPLYKKYFMHGTSHFIGLDVHDVGLWNRPIEVGNVFTVEPGIYIREENMGIRLENDILITETGYEDLMKNIPLEVEEIEAAMAEK